MKKMIKALVTAAVAGCMCVSALGLAACGSETVEVPGKSAYEIAVDNGFVGTETEWLASLTTITPGKSAYEIAVENGFVGTEAEWLASLTTTGKSAYEIAVDNGFVGTEAEWLASLTTTTPGKSAYEIAVANGFEGTEEEWLASLQVETPGKSAYEIAVEEGFEGTQAEWLESLHIEVPATVSSMTSTVGVNAKGQAVVTVRFTMSDGSTQTKDAVLPRRVVSATLQLESIIMTAEDALKLKNKEQCDYNGFVWRVAYDDGSSGYMPMQTSQLLRVRSFEDDHHEGPDQEPWDGTFEDGHVYKFEFVYGKNWYTTQQVSVYICNDITTIAEYTNHGYSMNYPRSLQKNEAFDLKTVFISRSYDLDSLLNETYGDMYWGYINYSYIVPVTQEMLHGTIDTSETGRLEFSIDYADRENECSICVYDPEVSIVENMYVDYGNLPDELRGDIVISAGENAEEELAEILSGFVDAPLHVYYCINVNGSNYAELTVTEDMIDYSEVDFTTPGSYFAYIKYQGASERVYVAVLPDMSAAQKQHSLTGNGLTILTLMMEGVVVTKADLYDNGYCELFAPNGESGELVSLTSFIGYVQYTLNNNVLEVKYDNESLAIFTVDTEENTFVAYDFEAAELTATVYTGSLPMGYDSTLDFTLKTYANGYGEFIVDMGGETTFVVGYTLEDGVVTILPTEARLAFTIGEDNVLTMVDD